MRGCEVITIYGCTTTERRRREKRKKKKKPRTAHARHLSVRWVRRTKWTPTVALLYTFLFGPGQIESSTSVSKKNGSKNMLELLTSEWPLLLLLLKLESVDSILGLIWCMAGKAVGWSLAAADARMRSWDGDDCNWSISSSGWVVVASRGNCIAQQHPTQTKQQQPLVANNNRKLRGANK